MSTLRLGGVASFKDVKKMPAEDELVVFLSHHLPNNRSGPSEKSEERTNFAIVRHSQFKTIEDGITQIKDKGWT